MIAAIRFRPARPVRLALWALLGALLAVGLFELVSLLAGPDRDFWLLVVILFSTTVVAGEVR